MAVSEWDQRQLCADGGCIGVIGSDGTCKVCGRAAPNWGDERMRGLVGQPQGEPDPDDDHDEGADRDDGDGPDEADGAAGPAGDAPVGGAVPTWTVRELCPDGSCIGVMGDDGRCKVCGRRAPGAAAAPAPAVSAADGAASDREHCADPSCAGLIGADGRCERCGKGAS